MNKIVRYNNNTYSIFNDDNDGIDSILYNITKIISAYEYLKEFNYDIFYLQIRYHQFYYEFYSSLERVCYLIDEKNSLLSSLQEIENFSKDQNFYKMKSSGECSNEKSILSYNGGKNTFNILSEYTDVILKVIRRIIIICDGSISNNTNFINSIDHTNRDIDEIIKKLIYNYKNKKLELKKQIDLANKSFLNFICFNIFRNKLNKNLGKEKKKKILLLENIGIIKKDFLSIKQSLNNYSKKNKYLINFWKLILKEVELLKEIQNLNQVFEKTHNIIQNIKKVKTNLSSLLSILKQNDFENICFTKIILKKVSNYNQ